MANSQRRYCYWDSEFTRVSHPRLRTVSASFLYEGQRHTFWCDDPVSSFECMTFLNNLPRDVVMVAFNVESEARFMISLGMNPREWTWQCLYLEYLMLNNHCHEIAYGKHLVDGQVKRLRPFVDEKGKTSLAAALYKMLGVQIDTAHKSAIRDLIISDPDHFSDSDIASICSYNESDVEYLPRLQKAIANFVGKKLPKHELKGFFDEAAQRAAYAIESAYMVTRGYPINVEWARNLTDNIEPLLDECIRDINSQFDPALAPFSYEKKNRRWKANQRNWRTWIRSAGLADKWDMTDGGKSGIKNLSLALEAFEKHFNYRHSFPRGHYGAQIVRYLKLKQSLNGFREAAGKSKKTFWDYVGPDGRVRPYFNIYGSQSSRSQPSATSYIHLKPAWQRTIVNPPKGKMIVGIDYASQEVLIAALLSGDKKLIQTYASGDVYLASGKAIGTIPKDGTKQTHKKERDQQKPVVLGWMYWMTGHGLSADLTDKTGREWSVEEAQDLLDKLDEEYYVFAEFRQETIQNYWDNGYLKLRDGWAMFGDNGNKRSIGNCPVQGAGADIMRRAVRKCSERGLEVIITLHDALYIECDVGDWEAVETFKQCMIEAFIEYFPENPRDASLIRIDTYAWGEGLEEGRVGDVDTMPIYVDERAVEEFDKFKQYIFESSGAELL
jgi:hypothetical protein